jgi:sensor histidine kinase YesM
MNVIVATDLAAVPRSESRLGPAFKACAGAWSSLRRRHWLVAAGGGAGVGIAYAAVIWLVVIESAKPHDGLPMFAVMVTHWIPLMTAIACALAFGVALLRDIGQRGAIRPRHVTLTILAVVAFAAIVDPITVYLATLVSNVVRPSEAFFTDGSGDWLTALFRMYTNSIERVFVFVSTVTLSAVYFFRISRTTDALANAQIGLSEARRRALGEELRSAQAALDPEFLFATLAEVDRRFESEPEVAQRLLDALIRYLRAALPTTDEAIGTLGQQAVLVRAYLDVETIRSAGRLHGEVYVPSELEARPFAPALVMPLVALVANGHADIERETRLEVRASVQASRLVIEVRGDRSGSELSDQQESTLASLRERVLVLYGGHAQLSYAREPSGSSAKIVIADPGSL